MGNREIWGSYRKAMLLMHEKGRYSRMNMCTEGHAILQIASESCPRNV